MPDRLILPHGGKLINLLVDSARAAELKLASRDWPSLDLTARQLCDLELILNGSFSPLQGFLSRADYENVCAYMRLVDGTLWPIPITLDVREDLGLTLNPGATLALRDPEGVLLAALHIEEVWRPDRTAEAEAIFGTTNREHPGVVYLLDHTFPYYVGGKVEGLQLPTHYDFGSLRYTPQELRSEFVRLGWRRVVAFQTQNPLHRAHQELILRVAKQVGAHLLLHPVVRMSEPGDVDHYTRVRYYQVLLTRYALHTVKLALLPLAMRFAGPREALWNAIVRKNYGCTHFVVERDHAGLGTTDSAGRSFYPPYAAQELLQKHTEELGVGMVPFEQMVYVEDLNDYLPENEVPAGARVLSLSWSELRRRLAAGSNIPNWFTFPEVATALRRLYPSRQGITVFFTGLSGSGKSTIARILQVKFLEMGGRPVTLLDGDLVRKNLSSELGFSKEHRDINIRRIGFVASEITKNGGIALCAQIAPYDGVRKEVRQMIELWGRFVLVYVATPIEVCEQRDRKGLYAKARTGLIREFTGISDPYEPPEDGDVVLDTTDLAPEEAAQQIFLYLERTRYEGVDG